VSDRKVADKPADVNELSRRDFVKGAAVAGVVIGADEYVKPTLKLLGVSRLSAAASNPPPRPVTGGGATKGCRPAFWAARGSSWWNTSNDSNWPGRGHNPFAHATLFTAVFHAHSAVNGRTMWQVLTDPGTSNAHHAARQLVAASLNAAYGGFAPGHSALAGMWNLAVETDTTAGWAVLRETVAAANGACEGRAGDDEADADNHNGRHD
jgi:hypothetical protein